MDRQFQNDRGYETFFRRFSKPELVGEKKENIEPGDIFGELVLQTLLCERLRYIMETLQVAGSEPLILEILISVASYSRKCASYLYTCPGLVEFVIQRYVNSSKPLTPGESEKIAKAIKLLRTLCVVDRSICLKLSQEGVINSIKNKFILSYPLVQVDHQLFMEAMRIWRVCLTFGMEHSNFTEILRHFLLVVHSLKLDDPNSVEKVSSIFQIVECMVWIGEKASSASWGWSHVTSLISVSQKYYVLAVGCCYETCSEIQEWSGRWKQDNVKRKKQEAKWSLCQSFLLQIDNLESPKFAQIFFEKLK